MTRDEIIADKIGALRKVVGQINGDASTSAAEKREFIAFAVSKCTRDLRKALASTARGDNADLDDEKTKAGGNDHHLSQLADLVVEAHDTDRPAGLRHGRRADYAN
jgi:hypothetical protein